MINVETYEVIVQQYGELLLKPKDPQQWGFYWKRYEMPQGKCVDVSFAPMKALESLQVSVESGVEDPIDTMRDDYEHGNWNG